MNTRPIPMAAPMVLANLAHRASQTRRTTGLENIPEGYEFSGIAFPHRFCESTYKNLHSKYVDFEKGGMAVALFHNDSDGVGIPCPYGTIGDILWMQEGFKYAYTLGEWMIQYRADLNVLSGDELHQKIEKKYQRFLKKGGTMKAFSRWLLGLHMHRWASRRSFEITNIRVERMQDITEDDAIASGISCMYVAPDGSLHYPDYAREDHYLLTPRDSYRSFVNSIDVSNAWGKNQLVWVIEYKPAGLSGEDSK